MCHLDAAMVQAGPRTVCVAVRPRCESHDADCADIENASSFESWRVPLRLQREVWESREGVAGLEFLQVMVG